MRREGVYEADLRGWEPEHTPQMRCKHPSTGSHYQQSGPIRAQRVSENLPAQAKPGIFHWGNNPPVSFAQPFLPQQSCWSAHKRLYSSAFVSLQGYSRTSPPWSVPELLLRGGTPTTRPHPDPCPLPLVVLVGSTSDTPMWVCSSVSCSTLQEILQCIISVSHVL